MFRKLILMVLFAGFVTCLFSQEYVQEIRGIVKDAHTGITLPGATIILTSLTELKGTTSDGDGRFILSQVPVGRHSIKVSFIGYKPFSMQNFAVTTGRETFLEIKLEESVQMLDEVVFKYQVNKDLPLNEMAMVSARMFTIEETDRYAGSLGDPARMAANFAGVNSLNDQSNDIVIRGNSPFGLLWTLEGVDIPNPNHFGAQGATGGPISMLNNNTLNNSDFLTGAFPAQYGNALSGVFDLGMRQGNTTKYEFMGQFAFNGFEAGVEGPISRKNHTSFMANYRYSTLGVLDKIVGLEKMALIAVPYYQDLNFNATLYRGKAGRVSVFGLMGFNHMSIDEDTADPSTWNHELYGQQARMGAVNGTSGIRHWKNFGERFTLESTLAATSITNTFSTDTVSHQSQHLTPQRRGLRDEKTLFLSSKAVFKQSARNIFQAGFSLQPMQYRFTDSLYQTSASGFSTLYDMKGKYLLSKNYIQWLHNFTDELSVSSGFHLMYFSGSDKISPEPRMGLRWMFIPGQSLNFAAGLHGQLAPRIFYVYEFPDINGNVQRVNKNLDFTRSLHLVAGYDRKITTDSRLKAELYYQKHFNVPVSADIPGWSMLNFGAEWIDFITPTNPLVSKGTGENLGVEMTLEKFFSRSYYYLLTASVFDSKYTGYDGIKRNTAFNGNYIFNALAGKEFNIKDRNVLSVDAKVVWAGGKPYLPFSAEYIDEQMYRRKDDWDNAYNDRMKDFFRINLRVAYKINLLHTTHELAVDLYNITNRKNIFMNLFDSVTGETNTMYQFSFMPVALYRVTF
jgi:hypothetical protein